MKFRINAIAVAREAAQADEFRIDRTGSQRSAKPTGIRIFPSI